MCAQAHAPHPHTHLVKTALVAPQVGLCRLLQRPSMRRYLPGVQVSGEAKRGQMAAAPVPVVSSSGRSWAISAGESLCLWRAEGGLVGGIVVVVVVVVVVWVVVVTVA